MTKKTHNNIKKNSNISKINIINKGISKHKHLHNNGKMISKIKNSKGITKKYVKYRSHNNTILINKKKTKTIHSGGFFDYAKLHWQMYKFNKILTELNSFDNKIHKEIESYKIQANTFEKRAKDKADIQTDIINNYRQKIIYRIYQKDETELPEKKDSIKIEIKDSMKTLDDRILSLGKKSLQLDKAIGKDMPEYNRLMKSFEEKIQSFNKITEKYAKQSSFYQEIYEIRRSYDFIMEANKTQKDGLSIHDKKKISKFEKNKVKYMKVLKLSDSELQDRKNLEQEIADLLKKTEYFKDQFGTYKGTKKDKTNVGGIDSQMAGISCNKKGDGLLCQWYSKYTDFAEYLVDLVNMCNTIIEHLKNISIAAERCVSNVNSVIINYKNDSHPEAVLRFQSDINEIISIFDLITKSITLLKAEFYKQTPTSSLIFDYNEIIVEINYIESKLQEYFEIFNSIDELKDKQDNYTNMSGGDKLYLLEGGSQSRARSRSGSRSWSRTNSQSRKSQRSKKQPEQKQQKTLSVDLVDKLSIPITYDTFFKNITQKEFTDITNLDIQNDKITEDNVQIFANNMHNIYIFWLNIHKTHNTHNNDNNNIALRDLESSINNLLNIDDVSSYKENIKQIHTELLSGRVTLIPIYEKNETIFQAIQNKKQLININRGIVIPLIENEKPSYFAFTDFNAKYKNALLTAPSSPPPSSSVTQSTQSYQIQSSQTNMSKEKLDILLILLTNNWTQFDNNYALKLKQIVDLLLNICNYIKDENITFYNTAILNDLYNMIYKIIKSPQNKTTDITILDGYINILTNYINIILKPLQSFYQTLTDPEGKYKFDKKNGTYTLNKVIAKIILTQDTIPNIQNIIEEYKKIIQTEVETEKNKQTDEDKKKKDEKQKKVDYNLLQDVIKSIHNAKIFKIQEENVTNEFKTIKHQLTELIQSGNDIDSNDTSQNMIDLKAFSRSTNPLKKLSNTMQELTQVLLDIKVIEPQIVSVNVKENTAIDMKSANWIIDKIKKDTENLHKLEITEQLQALRNANKERKISGVQTITDEDMKKLMYQLLGMQHSNDRNYFNKIINTTDNVNILKDVNKLKIILDLLFIEYEKRNMHSSTAKDNEQQNIPKFNNENTRNLCFTLSELKQLFGAVSSTEHVKAIDDKINEIDQNNKCQTQNNSKNKQTQQQQQQQQQRQQQRPFPSSFPQQQSYPQQFRPPFVPTQNIIL